MRLLSALLFLLLPAMVLRAQGVMEGPATFMDSVLYYHSYPGSTLPDSVPIMISPSPIFDRAALSKLDSLDIRGFGNLEILVDAQGHAVSADCAFPDDVNCDPLLLSLVQSALPRLRFLPALEGGQPASGMYPFFCRFPMAGPRESLVAPQPIEKLPGIADMVKLRHYRERPGDCIDGSAWLRLRIDRRGNITEVVVAETDDPLISETAVAALRQLHFRPATLDGAAVEGWWTHHIYFRSSNCEQ